MATEFEVRLTPNGRGGNQLHLDAGFRVSAGDLYAQPEQLEEPAILHSSITPPRLKILAARYFLSRLKLALRNEAGATFYLEAFIQALRSATWVLQKHGANSAGFATWYEQQRQDMQADARLRAIVDLRNLSEKEGVEFIAFDTRTVVRFHRNGDVLATAGLPELRVAGTQFESPLEDLETSLNKISGIVEKAHQLGFISPSDKSKRVILEFLRELPDGGWENFDPA